MKFSFLLSCVDRSWATHSSFLPSSSSLLSPLSKPWLPVMVWKVLFKRLSSPAFWQCWTDFSNSSISDMLVFVTFWLLSGVCKDTKYREITVVSSVSCWKWHCSYKKAVHSQISKYICKTFWKISREEKIVPGMILQHSPQGQTVPDLLVFCDAVTASVDKGTDVVYLELCKAFDMLPHHILTSKLKIYRSEDWTV